MILAIDPGKDKCGLAVLENSGKVLERKILSREEAPASLFLYIAKYSISTLVVGRSASGKKLEKELSKLELRADIIFVSEKNSSLEARKRYWKEHKPQGLWKFVPTSLRVPPIPIDDYAAVILGERYLKD